MKKKENYEGEVIRLKFPNKGIVKVAGEEEIVQVKNTLPGQKISFQLTKNKKNKKEGRLLAVLEASEMETQIPPCPHFHMCGGCSYQTMPYEKQKNLKLDQVRALFEQILPEFPLEECLDSPVKWQYRNKMEFSFGDEAKGGELTLGLHKRGSFYDIVPVRECQIVTGDIRKILCTTVGFFSKRGTAFYHKISHEGYLRHLLVRNAAKTGEILVCLVTTSQEDMDLSEYKRLLLENEYDGRITGILHLINDGLSDVVRADQIEVLYGKDYFYEELLGLKFKISPFSFFQTNSLGAEVLYKIVREYVGDAGGKVIFDLYSGTGTIAQILARAAKDTPSGREVSKVIGVEIVEEAVEAARVNAAMNHLDNCEFIAGDVLKVIYELEEKPDLIVLDPPREGIHPKALRRIVEYGVEQIVYISCKPTSLAGELEMFLECGYRPVKAVCVDMFPWTRGVETVCLLSKLHADQHIEVDLQMDELDLTAAESKATYEEIKDYVLEHSGLKVSSLYIAQVKEKCGIIERVNYNLPKSENSRQPKCPPEKEAAIREALEYFRMI